MIGNKTEIINYLQDKKEEDIFEIVKKQEKSLRSIAQNRYYFGVIVKMLSEYHGYTPIEIHELLKITVGLDTTTGLDTAEFSFMCNMIRDLWKTKFEFYIPSPRESEDLKDLEKYLF